MKHVLMFAMILCLLAFPALAKDDEAAIRAVLDKYAAAWGSLNPDNAAPLYAKDASLVFYDILPLKFTGWNAYAEGVKPHFAQFATLKMTPKGDANVERRGNVAWTTGTYDLAVTMKEGGDPWAMEVRQTLILEKQGGDWKIVHEHFSTPLQLHEDD